MLIEFIIEMLVVGVAFVILSRISIDEMYAFIGHALIYSFYAFKHMHHFNDGLVTLFLVVYVLSFLTYYVFKGKEKLAQVSLLMIVIVAVKMIVIDLQNVQMIWKIVTSMAFGVSLLLLSYFLTPIIRKNKLN
jgi:hypothetical protein